MNILPPWPNDPPNSSRTAYHPHHQEMACYMNGISLVSTRAAERCIFLARKYQPTDAGCGTLSEHSNRWVSPRRTTKKIIFAAAQVQLWLLRYWCLGRRSTDSNFHSKINEAQREAEPTPSEPTLHPPPSGKYDLDQSVRACEVGLSRVARTLPITVSCSCIWNRNRTCAELWHVTVGQDRKNHG